MSSEGDYSPPPPPPKKKKKGDDDKDDSSRPHQPPDRSKSHRKSPPKLPNSSDGSSAGAIAGSIVGGALFLIVVVVLLVFCSTRGKRRRRKKSREDDSDSDDSLDDRDSYFRHEKKRNNTNPNPNPNPNPNTSDHLVKIPSQSGAVSGRMSSEYSWPMGRPPPPPPPPMMSSSELGSVSFMTSSSLRRPVLPIPPSPPLPPVPPSPPPPIALGLTQSSFSYDELVRATNGFAQSNLLGQGGFGYVYKGILPNGKEVAVKYLKMNNGQGERELQSEVEIISRVHHRHLVPLVGYCIAGSQRMLVYEFVSNDTLEFHLHGKGRPVMDWPIRLKIAISAAKGFAYLHEDCHPRIIHRDIKAANILLDLNFEAKVADFGLAKLSQDNYTHVSTRIMGTFGYLAPEYASTGKLTEKSDVFSFGIVLLELITGRRPLDRLDPNDDGLVDRARPILNIAATGGSYEELVDQRLEYNYDPMEMRRMVHCAAACIRHSARRRPKMSEIVNALQGNVSLDELDIPASGQGSAMNSRNNSEYDLRKLGGNSP